MYYMLVF